MDGGLFRKKSLERISSPEDLHDYMRVTSPRLWMLLGAIAVLLAGFVVFAATTRLESTEKIRVRVTEGGYITGRVPPERHELVKVGMPVRIGERTGTITQIENSAEQRLKVTFASSEPFNSDYFFISLGDGQDVELYEADGSLNRDLIYAYEEEGSYYVMADDAYRIPKGDTEARFWMVDLFEEDMKLSAGRLATISGLETEMMVTAIIVMDDPEVRPEAGMYDAEIVTENTSPISFLLN